MVGKDSLKETSDRMNPTDIPRIPVRHDNATPGAEAPSGSGSEKAFPTPSVSKCRDLPSDIEGRPSVSRVSEDAYLMKGGPSSWRQCPIRGDKSHLKKMRRDERCKYCRRLLSHSSSVWLGRGAKGLSLVSPPSTPVTRPSFPRRLLDSPMDEVAWACGRLWCTVRRRKRRRLSSHLQRKQINEAFSTLREILPQTVQPEEGDSAAAKVTTLRLAASYIQALSDLLKDTHLSEGPLTRDKGHNDDSASDDDHQKDKSTLERRDSDPSTQDPKSSDGSLSGFSKEYPPPKKCDEGGKSFAVSHLNVNKPPDWLCLRV